MASFVNHTISPANTVKQGLNWAGAQLPTYDWFGLRHL